MWVLGMDLDSGPLSPKHNLLIYIYNIYIINICIIYYIYIRINIYIKIVGFISQMIYVFKEMIFTNI